VVLAVVLAVVAVERARAEAAVAVVARARAEAGPSRTPFQSRAPRQAGRAARARMATAAVNLSLSPLGSCSRGAVLVVGREIRYMDPSKYPFVEFMGWLWHHGA